MRGYLGPINVLAALAATVALSPSLVAGQAQKPTARTAAAPGKETIPRTP
jgi:hypothetical protein